MSPRPTANLPVNITPTRIRATTQPRNGSRKYLRRTTSLVTKKNAPATTKPEPWGQWAARSVAAVAPVLVALDSKALTLATSSVRCSAAVVPTLADCSATSRVVVMRASSDQARTKRLASPFRSTKPCEAQQPRSA
ncbi:UNVERIFIED_CONTAM: hypothetical protein GTU68_023295 [Idotea baltica]|nr:hypothetical protein [Idotea baltica]